MAPPPLPAPTSMRTPRTQGPAKPMPLRRGAAYSSQVRLALSGCHRARQGISRARAPGTERCMLHGEQWHGLGTWRQANGPTAGSRKQARRHAHTHAGLSPRPHLLCCCCLHPAALLPQQRQQAVHALTQRVAVAASASGSTSRRSWRGQRRCWQGVAFAGAGPRRGHGHHLREQDPGDMGRRRGKPCCCTASDVVTARWGDHNPPAPCAGWGSRSDHHC